MVVHGRSLSFVGTSFTSEVKYGRCRNSGIGRQSESLLYTRETRFRQCDDSEVELTQLIDLNSNVEEHQEQADDALLNTITPSFVFDTNGGVKLSLQLPPTFTNNGNSTLSF
ncbi:uncharacterized protein DFL_009780 [Arthrobotrys flagrans]|uniref:Uncharacterized protein n=1 Tax=Arthrobotrys flagrans TaxID=97331 RepID=A0A436ZSM1_ARTFL|nr:hypothetical protein DFL_009780 [Arthrobotrys flagrans]